MVKINYLILCLISLLCLNSCSKEDRDINEEPNPDPYDTLEFYSMEYDFSKKEVNEVTSREFKESLENNSDQIIPVTFYPYLDQGTLEFNIREMETILDGFECEVPVPILENNIWSQSDTVPMKITFGKIMNFNPFNGNISFTIDADPWNTLRYSYILTFSELTVPFKAVFVGANYGNEYKYSGSLTIRVPINCDIKME